MVHIYAIATHIPLQVRKLFFTLKHFCELTFVLFTVVIAEASKQQSMFYSYCAQNTFACLICVVACVQLK